MNRRYALDFTMTLLLCTIFFCIPFVVASPPNLDDTHVHILDASDSPSCNARTLWDIISSCLLTLFACTWTAIHMDIPGMNEGVVAVAVRRLLFMVGAIFGPEFVIAWAAWQLLHARQVAREFNVGFDAQHPQPPDDHRAPWWSELAPTFFGYVPNSRQSSRWTVTHGFFACMGGFVLYVGDVPRATLTADELLRFVGEGSVERPDITKADIEERSKGDVISKWVAIFQLVWFIIQLFARFALGLPVTPLEIDTLGVVVLTCIAYGLWWKKPKDYVGRPHIVRWNATAPPPDNSLAYDRGNGSLSSLQSLVDYYKNRQSTQRNSIITIGSMAGMVFGAIHSLDWYFLFPSDAESSLWQSASLLLPAAFPMFMIAQIVHWLRRALVIEGTLVGLLGEIEERIILLSSILYYISARLLIIVLMILSLRSLPPGTYDTVVWIKFIPHASM